jgi:hypothetical protein
MRNHRRNRLQPPTTNLLRQKQSVERQPTPTPTRNQRHKPRSNSPKIPQHRLRRKTRQPNASTGWNAVCGNRRRHGKIQPLLRKSRHATHSRKQTQQTCGYSAGTAKQHGLQPHTTGKHGIQRKNDFPSRMQKNHRPVDRTLQTAPCSKTPTSRIKQRLPKARRIHHKNPQIQHCRLGFSTKTTKLHDAN